MGDYWLHRLRQADCRLGSQDTSGDATAPGDEIGNTHCHCPKVYPVNARQIWRLSCSVLVLCFVPVQQLVFSGARRRNRCRLVSW